MLVFCQMTITATKLCGMIILTVNTLKVLMTFTACTYHT